MVSVTFAASDMRVSDYPLESVKNCHMDALHLANTTPREDMGCPGSRVAHPGGFTDRP